MKRSYRCIGLSLTMFLLIACIDNGMQSTKNGCKNFVEFTQPAHHFCYVLCDYSKSQSPDSFAIMQKNAVELFDRISPQYRVKFFQIGLNYGQPVFFQYRPADRLDIESDMEIENRDNYRACMKDSLTGILAMLKKQQTENTCILSTIERVLREITSDVQIKTDTIRIVILSDLIEACNRNGRSINLTESQESEIRKIERNPDYLPAISFAAYPNLSASLIISTTNNKINGPDLFSFWNSVFGHCGLRLEGSYTTSLPAWSD